MKRLFIYWRAFLRGYRDSEQWHVPFRYKLETPEGIAEWWGYADGRALRVRSTTPPFCRACGQPMRASDSPHVCDPNLGLLCNRCACDRRDGIAEEIFRDMEPKYRQPSDLV
jgi:hypothetical protein